jgi:hypothetical protein
MTTTTDPIVIIACVLDFALDVSDEETLDEDVQEAVDSVACYNGDLVSIDYETTRNGDEVFVECSLEIRAALPADEDRDDAIEAVLSSMYTGEGRLMNVELDSVQDEE